MKNNSKNLAYIFFGGVLILIGVLMINTTLLWLSFLSIVVGCLGFFYGLAKVK